MVKYEIKKFPLAATILTLLGLVAAVISVTISLVNTSYDGYVSLALLEIVATVLIIAGLTTGKVTLLRVISIIITVCLLIAAFVLAIAKYAERDVYLFAISLFMLIASVLNLVYFLTLRNKKIEKFYIITSSVLTGLVIVYSLIYIITNVINYSNGAADLYPQTYAVLVAYACVTILPMMVYRSMDRIEVEEPQEEVVEEPLEDQPQIEE